MLLSGLWFAFGLWTQSFAPVAAASAGYRVPKLLDATLDELIRGLKRQHFTSVDLVNAYTARISEVDSTLRVVAELNPDALQIARDLDVERKRGDIRGPLHGIPILLKNNIATADKMNNTAGSYALLGAKVPHDSTVAAKLRQAGAILLGKTNLSQWANFRSSNSSSGWSATTGQTLGAYYPNMDPCGSSSGSGVASSLGLASASLGTETDGSIVCPSQRNNLVGIKPTVGLTSRSLVIPISEHQDTVGPIARTVKDAAYVLQAIAGRDPHDNYTSAIPFQGSLPDYVAACKLSALKGKRIGIPRNTFINATSPANAAILTAFGVALQVLKAAGATIVESTDYTAFEEYLTSPAESNTVAADFPVNLARYFAQLTHNPNNIHSLEDVRNFTQHFPLEDFPDRDTAGWDEALSLPFTQSSPEFWANYQRQLYLGGEGGILGALKKYRLDAIVMPTVYASGISAIIGAPLVTVPLGAYPAGTQVTESNRGLIAVAEGIPFGISFAGKKWSEAELIGFAYAFEQRTMVRGKVKPILEPRTEVRDLFGR